MTDEQVLAQAMFPNRCWHEWKKDGFFHMSSDDEDCGYSWTCKKCGEFSKYSSNPPPRPDLASSAVLWDVLQMMMRREDWEEFYDETWVLAKRDCFPTLYNYQASRFTKWLMSDPARFVHLCAEWCREHPVKGE